VQERDKKVREIGKTILSADDHGFIEELCEYMDVLSNSTRLRILVLLEKEPMDARTISARTEVSYETIKKHLEQLLHSGLITRRPGLGRETSKGIHPAWVYYPVPGVLEWVHHDLGVLAAISRYPGGQLPAEKVSRIQQKVTLELGCGPWALLLEGGEWDGHVLSLPPGRTAIGRAEEGQGEVSLKGNGSLSLPPSYRSVSRISRPHAVIEAGPKGCSIEDRGSTGGTFLNGRKVRPFESVPVRDGDMVSLSRGDFGATLVFVRNTGSSTGVR